MSIRVEHEDVGRSAASLPIGRKEPFVGTIKSAWYSRGECYTGVYFHVEDRSGKQWHRTRNELIICAQHDQPLKR